MNNEFTNARTMNIFPSSFLFRKTKRIAPTHSDNKHTHVLNYFNNGDLNKEKKKEKANKRNIFCE